MPDKFKVPLRSVLTKHNTTKQNHLAYRKFMPEKNEKLFFNVNSKFSITMMIRQFVT